MPKEASVLEIHFINVSQGDSILLINRDLDKLEQAIKDAKKTLPTDSLDWMPFAVAEGIDLEGTVAEAILIDGGEDYYGGDVFQYIQTYGIKGDDAKEHFATVVSHYHSDHTDGLRLIYKKKKGKKIVENYAPGKAYDMGDDPDLDPDTLTYSNYVDDIQGFESDSKTERVTLKPGDTIDMGEDKNKVPIKLRCLAANGVVYQGQGKKKKDIIDRKKTIDQNDRSLVLVVEYGDFRCMLGGDAGGNGRDGGGNFGSNQDTRNKKFWSSHGDLETWLREAVVAVYKKDPKRTNTADGHICCFKAHHHGSASSNDLFFLGAMQPTLVLCSSGTRVKFHGHPTQEALNRVDTGTSAKWPTPTSNKAKVQNNSILAYYITEMAVNGKYGWGGVRNQTYNRTFPNGKIMGDIVVRPFGAVQPADPNGANTISIQVYGTGAQAALDGDKKLRPLTTAKKTPPNYPLGPWEHSCDKH